MAKKEGCVEVAKKKKYHCSVDGCFRHRAKEGISFFTIHPQYLQRSNFGTKQYFFGYHYPKNAVFKKVFNTLLFYFYLIYNLTVTLVFRFSTPSH